MSNSYPRFADFADEEQPLEGKKKKLEDVLNIEILITDFRISKSKYNERDYITIQFENDNSKSVIFTGSSILIKQMERYKDKLPFYATIAKRNKYFTLT